jgi:branched-chain amino acid aminotransferase
MTEFKGSFFSEDIAFKETSIFNAPGDDSGLIIYEVLRIYKETCLFLEDHIQRLQESVKLSGYSYTVSVPLIHYILRGLIRRNGFTDGNIKIVLHFKPNTPHPLLYTYFIPHAYPTPAMYKNGVAADLYKAVRPNPNIKSLLPQVRLQVSEFIGFKRIYDALLVDEEDTITEGSKTNVFFIQEETVYTPPSDRVLKGITREKIIYLCSKLNINIIELPISINSLPDFTAAFFTGTSPKVLPIRCISDHHYHVSNPLMGKLIKAYNDLVASYVNC